MRRRPWLKELLPLVFVGGLVLLEHFLMQDPDPAVALGGQLSETKKKLIEMNDDLSKLFITISTAIVGGVAYYVRSRKDDFLSFSVRATTRSAMTVTSAVASVFFGHLWIVGMRNQLADDQFAPRAREVVWPERLQYVTLLLALCWFGLLVIEREVDRKAAKGDAASPEARGGATGAT